MTRGYASFGPVRSNILDLTVYDREAGSSLIVFTKLKGGGGGGLVKMRDRWTDGQTDRQTDRHKDRQTDALLTFAQACIFLSCLTL